MLEYETQMLLDTIYEDGLTISAKGLGLETIICNLLKVYCDPGNLVIVLGTTHHEEDFYISCLQKEKVEPLPKVITNEFTASDRETLYLGGGVLFVSPRILVVDLLKNRLPIQHVTGFVICRAHSILDSFQEAFALRLYRMKNKVGFVKAFSSSAQTFTAGFAHVDRIMKTLFVRNVYLWPRFHATVKSSLDKYKPQVVELHIPLTSDMLDIQTSLLDLMNFTIKELRRLNQTLDLEDVSVENAISKSFHKVLQLQLDPYWNQLSFLTCQMVADLKTLRLLLSSLTKYDCITFNKMVNSLRSSDYAARSSGWVLLESAEKLFIAAKRRVLSKALKPREGVDITPEPNPKWEVLSEVLKEINDLAQTKEPRDKNPVVLVLVEDNRTCTQLKQYLTEGTEAMLLRLYEKAFFCQVKQPSVPTVTGKEQKDKVVKEQEPAMKLEPLYDDDDEEEEFQESYTLSQKPSVATEKSSSQPEYECKEQKDEIAKQRTSEELLPPEVIIQTFKKQGNPTALSRTLDEIKSSFVVMYDPDMTTVRRLEVYQASNTDCKLRIYFLVYGASVEEQAYLTTLRREKEAFDYLIKERATMVVPADQDGKSTDCAELLRDPSRPNQTTNPNMISRKAGGASTSKSEAKSTVVVDMREFNSELPALIHKRGIEIEPVTLQIGDYILTPELCVERKSISDLIGSLNSGRLYNQALAMSRYYTKPILLIEFDQNKPFALQGRYYLSSDASSSDIVARLQLLTLHFPRLRLVWSPSPHATAQLFEELKQGRDEPNAAVVAAIGVDEQDGDVAVELEKFSSSIYDVVACLPGVTTKNLHRLLTKGQSLDHLLTLSEEELVELMNNSAEAGQLYNALHKQHVPTEDVKQQSSTAGGFGRTRTHPYYKRHKKQSL